jgi:hypothetical protein
MNESFVASLVEKVISVSPQLLHYISTVRLLPRMSHCRSDDGKRIDRVYPCMLYFDHADKR